MESFNRLTLPKRPPAFNLDELTTEKPGVPPNPLPIWSALPLEAKFPMIPGPKNQVELCTTKMGEKIQNIPPELDFDLTDVNHSVMSNDYKPLHDVHLKSHLKSKHIQRKLKQGGFITKDGRVLCTIKEFNEYRQYLRKINLALKRKRETEGLEEGDGLSLSQLQDTDTPTDRELRLADVRRRLTMQEQMDKERFERMAQEKEERARRIQFAMEERLQQNREKFTALQERRLAILRRRAMDERRRKQVMMKRWKSDDKRRAMMMARLRQEEDERKQQRLAQDWDARKKLQMDQLRDEEHRRTETNAHAQQGIARRERAIKRMCDKQQERFKTLVQTRRVEKERTEREHLRRLQRRIRHQQALKRQQSRNRHRFRPHTCLRSTWDIEDCVLAGLADSRADYRNIFSASDYVKELYKRTDLGNDNSLKKSLTDLRLMDMVGAKYKAEKLREAAELKRLMMEKQVGDIAGFDARKSIHERDVLADDLGMSDFHGITVHTSDNKKQGVPVFLDRKSVV